MIAPLFYTKIMLFRNLKKQVDAIVRELPKIGNQAIDEHLGTMADMNTDQMMQGLNADGEQIGEYKSPPYAAMKQSMNPRPPAFGVDLNLTGDFHSGTFAKRQSNTLIFGSSDSKTAQLTEKYGQNIFGLTEQNRQEVKSGHIFPYIFNWLNKKLTAI